MPNVHPAVELARRRVHRWKHVPDYHLLENWHAASKAIDGLLVISGVLIFGAVFIEVPA
jgi:hypothetical protein